MFGLGNIVEHEEPDDNTNKPDIEMDKYMPAVAVEDAAFSWSLHTVVPSLVIPSLHIPAGTLAVARCIEGVSTTQCTSEHRII